VSERAIEGGAPGGAAETPEPIDPRLRAHYCFGCGEHNPIGLSLHFERDAEGVVAPYQPRREDQGFPGLVHGGLISLLLDEAMGWAMYADEAFAVTARMETRFRRPVPLDRALLVRSRILSSRGRRLEVEAKLCDAPTGDLLAEASGLFVRMSPDDERAALARFREASEGGD
jgi:acyl-coenzyme A thioesterase PaaI-like protein